MRSARPADSAVVAHRIQPILRMPCSTKHPNGRHRAPPDAEAAMPADGAERRRGTGTTSAPLEFAWRQARATPHDVVQFCTPGTSAHCQRISSAPYCSVRTEQAAATFGIHSSSDNKQNSGVAVTADYLSKRQIWLLSVVSLVEHGIIRFLQIWCSVPILCAWINSFKSRVIRRFE